MKPCIIFDVDGTVANCDHRTHLVTVNFAAFEEACDQDTAYEDVLWILKLLINAKGDDYDIFIASGRQELYRDKTVAFFQSHGVFFGPRGIDDMFMRPTGDCRKDSIVKAQILDHIQQTHQVKMVFDDRQQVVDMWRERGITCAQVREWVEGNKQKYVPGKMWMMVGPSGAGKSTHLGPQYRDPQHSPSLLSSDEFRIQLCGNKLDQSKNEQVFDIMRGLAKARLLHGLNVTIDATNLRNKDRLAFVDLVPGVEVHYVVIDRPLEAKLRDRGWRSEELVRRHDQLFKSNIKFILNGDGRPNVTVHDKRTYK